MSNPIIRIHNVTTDEVIDREMTDEEFAEFQNEQSAMQAAEAETAAKAAEAAAAKQAAQAKLAALGLTTDDLKALGL